MNITLFLIIIQIICVVLLFLLYVGVPLKYLGIPLYCNDVRWTWFVYRNMKKAKVVDGNLIYDGKIIIFYYSWLWNVYEGDSRKEVARKYSIGGQSNKANHLTWYQKLIGKKIEKWYNENIIEEIK